MKRFIILLLATLLFTSASFANAEITGVEAQCIAAAVKCFQEQFKGKYDLNDYDIDLHLQEDNTENMKVDLLPKLAEGEPPSDAIVGWL